MDGLAVAILIIFLTIGLGLIFSRGEVTAVQADWANRRCEPGVLFAGFMYKPADDPRSAGAFAADNFQFCMKSLAQSVINELMAPILGTFRGIMDNTTAAGGSLNNIRTVLSSISSSFSSTIGGFTGVYNRTLMQAVRSASQLRMALDRMFGISLSAFYAGLSSLFAGLNMFQFIIKVIVIILGIMLGIMIILIFVLFPFMPLIMSVIGAMVAATAIFVGVVGTDVGKMADGFCFTGDTPVVLGAGQETRSISEISIGDVLEGGAVVEGLLKFDGNDVTLFNYHGIRVSGEHLVFHEGAWRRVLDAGVSPLKEKAPLLYSLVTSTHRIPIGDSQGATQLFADWEEFGEDSDIYNRWHTLVQDELGIPINFRQPAKGDAHMSGSVCVIGTDNDRIPIGDVQVGDKILDNDGYVIVLGKYETAGSDDVIEPYVSPGTWVEVNTVGRSTAERAAWMRSTSMRGGEGVATAVQRTWKQGIPGGGGCTHNHGMSAGRRRYHLITTSGTYNILVCEDQRYRIRDFTEIGVPALKRISAEVADAMTKKLSG